MVISLRRDCRRLNLNRIKCYLALRDRETTESDREGHVWIGR